MRLLLILFFSVTTFVVEARMYQWTESGVETTQLSGKPPAWYRSAVGGTRVFVFDKGRLIDDTAVEVSDEVRQHLRQQAFILAEDDRQKAQEKIAKAQELKQKFKNRASEKSEQSEAEILEEEDLDVESITATLFPEKPEDEEQEKIEDKDIDELRAMIEAWEKSQTESAKRALE